MRSLGVEGIDTRFLQRLEQWDSQEVICKTVLLWGLDAEADTIEEPPTTALAKIIIKAYL